jgi:hypothetical protein
MIRVVRLLPTALASLGLLTACAGQNGAIVNANRVPSGNDTAQQVVFHFTGIVQTFQVPSGVEKVTIIAKGAGTPAARGGLVKATITVDAGDSLSITVGGAPKARQGGYNGGGDGGACGEQDGCLLRGAGGAGASDVRRGGSALEDRVVVAGGAGGRGGPGMYHGGAGGDGGGVTGAHGDNGVPVGSRNGSYGHVAAGGGAGGATQRRGGTRGAAGKSGYIPGSPGSAGTLAIGGRGANNFCQICSVTYSLMAGGAGGGGGGGYYGGGGGGSGGSSNAYENYQDRKAMGSGGGGGGGSSFVESGAQNVSIETGKGNSGDGLIIISW